VLRIGSQLPDAIPETLVRGLAPMARQIRATMPALAEKAIASGPDNALRSLDSALKSSWPASKIEALVVKQGQKVLDRSNRDWAPLRQVLDGRRHRRDQPKMPDGRRLLAEWAKESTKRITSVRNSVVPGLRRDILHAIEHDWSPEQLMRAWVGRKIPLKWGTLEGRSRVIAHTELRTLQADIQRERATAVGVEQFRWITQNDGRVRDHHLELHETTHDYASPPAIGLPGTEPNCRCWMESIITDAFLANLGVSISLAA
jgi:SPP1 gp7 family putative phage head morphogenesis protein